ncbi:MAG: hypothetical protein IJJ28_03645 [Lentisphaeria bacterium]|nr:hypothetical protein [Lentisphaeria bacterium]
MIDFIVPELAEFFPLSPDPRRCRVLNEPLAEFLARELAALPDRTRWRMDCVPAPGFADKLARLPGFEVRDADGEVVGSGGDPAARQTVEFAGTILRYPWDLLALNESRCAALDTPDIRGEVAPAAYIDGVIRLGEGSRLLPGVCIEGNVVIGRKCKIGPNCYLRGNTVIGDNCHIGQAVEIKNSVIGDRTAVGHLSYVGDSVLGDRVNFGAGTIIGNLRHDGKNHRSPVAGKLVDTGRRKFGAIVGDGVHTGIHTAIYPGRKLAAGAATRPGEVVRTDLEAAE